MRRLRAGRALRRAAPRARRGRRRCCCIAATRARLPRASAASSCRRSTRARSSTCRRRRPACRSTEAAAVLQRMDRELLRVPRGGARVRQDRPRRVRHRPAPLSMVETIITLKPTSEWRAGHDAATRWCSEMDEKPPLAGHAATSSGCRSRPAPRCSRPGIRSELGVKVLRRRPRRRSSAPASRSRRRSRGAAGHAQRRRRAPHRRLLPRPARRPRGRGAPRPARAGRERGGRDARSAGRPCRRSVEGRRALPDPGALRARLPRGRGRAAPRARGDAGRRAGAARPGGASSSSAMGPPFVRSEAGRLVGYVLVDVAGDRPIVDYVAEAKRAIAERVSLPAGRAPRVGGAVPVLRARAGAAAPACCR